MHKISSDLFLSRIELRDSKKLYDLVFRIYPPIYEHLWLDKGEWYLNSLYSESNLEKELTNLDSRFFFIIHDDVEVGILKLLLNEPMGGVKNKYSTKLQRIYLDSSVQGKGFGKQIINWVEKAFCTAQNSVLWLEVMDTQEKAIKFYEKIGFNIVDEIKFESDLMVDDFRGMYRMAKEF